MTTASNHCPQDGQAELAWIIPISVVTELDVNFTDVCSAVTTDQKHHL